MKMPSRNKNHEGIRTADNKQTNQSCTNLSVGMGHPGVCHTLNKKHRRSQNFNQLHRIIRMTSYFGL
jgi:hypothetical protein